MSVIDDIYHVAVPANGPGIIYLKPDEETADRNYTNSHQLPGRPLHFLNGFREEMAEDGEKESITDVLFDSDVFMVSERVYHMIADFDIADLQCYPSVYEADDGKLYDYMFLIFDGTMGQDWLDRDLSDLDEEEDLEEGEKPFVDRFVLDEKKIRAIPEEQRLMFRMTGVMNPMVFVHQRIVDLFAANAVTGIRFIRVSDYEDGMEFG